MNNLKTDKKSTQYFIESRETKPVNVHPVIRFIDLEGKETQVDIFPHKPLSLFSFLPLSKELYAPVSIEGFSHPFYIKIKEISQSMGISEKVIQNALSCDPQTINRLMDVNKEFQQAFVRSKSFLNILGLKHSSPFMQALHQLKLTLHPNTISKLLDSSDFLTDKKIRATVIDMTKTVTSLKAGTSLSVRKTSEQYGYLIDSNGKIYIRFNEIGKGVAKKASRSIDFTTWKNYASITIKDNLKMGINATDSIRQEEQAFDALQGIEQIAPPYVFKMQTTTKKGLTKWILIQELFDRWDNYSNIDSIHLISVLTDISTALAAMHERKLIHGDVKPANLLLKGDLTQTDQVVRGYLNDFGTLTHPGLYQGGTVDFYPPELYHSLHDEKLQDLATTYKWDSYALGVTALSMMTQRVKIENKCFAEATQKDIDDLIEETRKNLKDEKKLEILDIITHLLVQDPTQRWTCQEASEAFRKLRQ